MTVTARIPALLAAGLLASAVAAASPVRQVHKALPLAADGRLTVSTYKGSVTVSCWDRPEVEISARIEPDGSDSDSDRKVAETKVVIEGGGASVRVRSDYEDVREHSFFGIFGFRDGSLPFVHYTIHMPATARLDVDDYKSETRVAGLRSDLKLHTYKGTVDVQELDGAAAVDTYKGEVRITFARYSRASRFETYKGSFEVRLPRDSRFDLEADGGRRGEVDSDFAVAAKTSRRYGGESARGAINGGGPTLTFETRRGSLRLRSR